MLTWPNVMEFNVDGEWAEVGWAWRVEGALGKEGQLGRSKVLFTKSLGPTSQLPVDTITFL